MAKKKLYHVPILKPEHCSQDFMDQMGIPDYGDDVYGANRWAAYCIPLRHRDVGDVHWTFWDKYAELHPNDYWKPWTAARFNATARALGGKPTGKPWKKGKQ